MRSLEQSIGTEPGAMWDHVRCGSIVNDDFVFCTSFGYG